MIRLLQLKKMLTLPWKLIIGFLLRKKFLTPTSRRKDLLMDKSTCIQIIHLYLKGMLFLGMVILLIFLPCLKRFLWISRLWAGRMG